MIETVDEFLAVPGQGMNGPGQTRGCRDDDLRVGQRSAEHHVAGRCGRVGRQHIVAQQYNESQQDCEGCAVHCEFISQRVSRAPTVREW